MRERRLGNVVESREEEEVLVELSRAQVDHVVREATGAGNMAIVLSRLAGSPEMLEVIPSQLSDGRLSRSLLYGLLILALLPVDGGYLSNSQLASMLEMNASTAHRYVSTLVAMGLVERDSRTRRYRLAL